MGKKRKHKSLLSAITRRARRSRPKTARLMRLGMMVTLACVALMAIWMVGAKAARPYLISYGESKEIADVKAQIAQAEAENKALEKEIAYLSKKEGMEAEARKLGWVKQGEIPVVIEQPRKSHGLTPSPAPEPVRQTFWHSALGWLLKPFARPGTAH